MKRILIGLSMLILFTGCISKELTFSIPVIKENEMISEISIKIGDVLNLEFESNPSTGYQWFVKYDETMLKLLHSKFVESDTKNLVGAPGKQSFKFRAIKKGKTTLEFVYKRQWEKDKPPAKKVVYNITVN